jgi:hypothetical protein
VIVRTSSFDAEAEEAMGQGGGGLKEGRPAEAASTQDPPVKELGSIKAKLV